MVEQGELEEAGNVFRGVLYGKSSYQAEARARIEKLHQNPKVDSMDLEKIPPILELVVACRKQIKNDPVGKSIFEKGMTLVESRAEDDLDAANKILTAIESVARDEDRFHTAKHSVLNKLVAKRPDDINLTCELAEALEGLQKLDQCEKLLEPISDRLGESEGARILGQIWATKGKIEQAHTLLEPYCEKHLRALNQAETRFNSLVSTEQNKLIQQLQNRKGPDGFYRKYEKSTPAQQQAMVQKYLADKLENNQQIEEARQKFVAETKVVPVALDLGVVKLRRAQSLKDVAQQQKELKEAEKTFKSIRGVAGESDEYRLYMGQVNYWLGKFDEGKKLFDELLEANNRNASILLTVSSIVREVGRTSEARQLAEEAYNKSTMKQIKNQLQACGLSWRPIVRTKSSGYVSPIKMIPRSRLN